MRVLPTLGAWARQRTSTTARSLVPRAYTAAGSVHALLQDREESREWAHKLLAKKRTLPRYMQRRERPWFRKGKTLLKELASA